jgi:hypothetical protein
VHLRWRFRPIIISTPLFHVFVDLAFQRRIEILCYERVAQINSESAVKVGDETLQVVGMDC